MKKAVVLIGGKQYFVEEQETLRVDLLPAGRKELETGALLVIDGDKTLVGRRGGEGGRGSRDGVGEKVAGEKIRVIRYHSKKRVHKETGHRQKYSLIKIEKIG